MKTCIQVIFVIFAPSLMLGSEVSFSCNQNASCFEDEADFGELWQGGAALVDSEAIEVNPENVNRRQRKAMCAAQAEVMRQKCLQNPPSPDPSVTRSICSSLFSSEYSSCLGR